MSIQANMNDDNLIFFCSPNSIEGVPSPVTLSSSSAATPAPAATTLNVLDSLGSASDTKEEYDSSAPSSLESQVCAKES